MHLLLICSLIFVSVFFELVKGNNTTEIICNRIRYNKVLFMGFILFIFAALRDISVGIDIYGYAKGYENINIQSFSEIMTLREGRDPIFSIFCKLLTYISPSPQCMLIAVGAIVAICFSYYVYHQKGDVLLSFILFITFRLYAFTLTGLRQAIALSFCWVAFVMLQKGRNIRFFIFTAIASLFHASAIVFVIAWFFYKFSKPIVSFVLCAIMAAADLVTNHAIINLFSKLLAEDRFDSYTNAEAITSYSGGGTFYLYMFFFAFIVFSMYFGKDEKKEIFTNKVFNVACIGMMFYVLCQNLPVFFRISYYFILPFYVLIPHSIDLVFNKRDRVVIRSLIIVFLTAQYIILKPGAGIDNYQFFWAGV